MGPREEDNGFLLLGTVAAICALIAFAPSLLESTPAEASKALRPGMQADSTLQPARVIVPFTPNTTPRER